MVKKGVDFNCEALAEIIELDQTVDPGLLDNLIAHFKEQAPRFIKNIQRACEIRNFSDLEHNAHSLKSSSSLLGFECLAHLCYEIETEAAAHVADTLKAQRIEKEFGVAFERILDFQKSLAK